jgi:hypothetical protein
MFEKIELEVNQRSKDDPVHSEVIAGMRDVTRAINLPAILDLYSRIDVTNPKNNVGFEDAIIAVAGNDEGHAVNDVRGKDFALKHGKPIVKWRKQPSGKSRPLKNTPRFEERECHRHIHRISSMLSNKKLERFSKTREWQ